jgi:hypothetical protein
VITSNLCTILVTFVVVVFHYQHIHVWIFRRTAHQREEGPEEHLQLSRKFLISNLKLKRIKYVEGSCRSCRISITELGALNTT